MAATTATYQVYRQHIPRNTIDDALRAINQHLANVGLHQFQRDVYAQTACWFPELYDHPALRALQNYLPVYRPGDVWTQIVLQFPQNPGTPEPAFHVDDPPVDGRRFLWVAGVPLTRSDRWHGGIKFDARNLSMLPGDVVLFPGDLPHHGGVNHSPHIRYAAYFRYLEPPDGVHVCLPTRPRMAPRQPATPNPLPHPQLSLHHLPTQTSTAQSRRHVDARSENQQSQPRQKIRMMTERQNTHPVKPANDEIRDWLAVRAALTCTCRWSDAEGNLEQPPFADCQVHGENYAEHRQEMRNARDRLAAGLAT